MLSIGQGRSWSEVSLERKREGEREKYISIVPATTIKRKKERERERGERESGKEGGRREGEEEEWEREEQQKGGIGGRNRGMAKGGRGKTTVTS